MPRMTTNGPARWTVAGYAAGTRSKVDGRRDLGADPQVRGAWPCAQGSDIFSPMARRKASHHDVDPRAERKLTISARTRRTSLSRRARSLGRVVAVLRNSELGA